MDKNDWFTQDEMRISIAMKIRRENFFHGGVMPREAALYWNGYLSGCGSGGGISGAVLIVKQMSPENLALPAD